MYLYVHQAINRVVALSIDTVGGYHTLSDTDRFVVSLPVDAICQHEVRKYNSVVCNI